MNRILNQIINQLVRRMVNFAINAGFDLWAGKGKKPQDMTPEEHEQAQKSRDLAKRAKDAARITRKL